MSDSTKPFKEFTDRLKKVRKISKDRVEVYQKLSYDENQLDFMKKLSKESDGDIAVEHFVVTCLRFGINAESILKKVKKEDVLYGYK